MVYIASIVKKAAQEHQEAVAIRLSPSLSKGNKGIKYLGNQAVHDSKVALTRRYFSKPSGTNRPVKA